MIDLYFATTSNGFRARIALEECELPYRLHTLNLQAGEHRTADYLRINPLAQIPAIVDPDGPRGSSLTVTQSSAILVYCAEKCGRFIPLDPARRIEALQWMMLAITDLGPASSNLFYMSVAAPNRSAENTAYLEERLLRYLLAFEDRLAQREYLVDEITLADLATYPTVAVRRPLIEKSGGFPQLLRWAAALEARPAIARAMA